MATLKIFLFIVELLISFLIINSINFISPASSLRSFSDQESTSGIRAAYWPSFTGFSASAINTSFFTHIYYAFLLPSPDTNQLNITQFDQQKIPELVSALHVLKPPVKIMLSIGGGGNDPLVFSKLAAHFSTRATFINSTIEVARRYGFDGVDLDWEFPKNTIDMSNLGLLFMQWRKALEDEAKATKRPRLLLTSAVYYASNLTQLDGTPRAYPVDVTSKYVDWVNPMCYDYHGAWENVTGEHSALYDPNNSDITTNFGIKSWIQAGMPPTKIVMGLPLYGRTWKLQDPNVNGIGSPAVGSGPGDGVLIYSRVVDFNSGNSATIKFDPQTVSYYSYAGDSWIGYDDVQSIKSKVQFAKERNLGGYFFWALGQDKSWTLSSSALDAWMRSSILFTMV